MKKLKDILILIACILVIASHFDAPVSAQAAQAFPASQVSANTGTTSQCPTVASGQGGWCIASGIVYVSQNGAAWTEVSTGSAAAPSLTINGTTKTLPASFTIAATAPTISAPTATATVTAPTASAPTVTAN